MKTYYTPKVIAFIEAAKLNLTPVKLWIDVRNWDMAKIEFNSMGSEVISVISNEMAKDPSLAERSKELERTYEKSFYSNTECTHEGAETKWRAYKTFNNREEMLAYLKSHNLNLPKEVKKEGVVVGSNIHTNLEYKIQLAEDAVIRVDYTRKGSPTPHCRVETSTYTSVVCDISNRD